MKSHVSGLTFSPAVYVSHTVRNVNTELTKRAKHSLEYEAFTFLVDRVLAVPHRVIKQRMWEERKRIAAHRPGPYRRVLESI
jgi:hypothetical protein